MKPSCCLRIEFFVVSWMLKLPEILLMEEILHQLVWQISDLQGFIHVGWCRISSINSTFKLLPWILKKNELCGDDLIPVRSLIIVALHSGKLT